MYPLAHLGNEIHQDSFGCNWRKLNSILCKEKEKVLAQLWSQEVDLAWLGPALTMSIHIYSLSLFPLPALSSTCLCCSLFFLLSQAPLPAPTEIFKGEHWPDLGVWLFPNQQICPTWDICPSLWVLNRGHGVGKRYILINSFTHTMWREGGVHQRK